MHVGGLVRTLGSSTGGEIRRQRWRQGDGWFGIEGRTLATGGTSGSEKIGCGTTGCGYGSREWGMQSQATLPSPPSLLYIRPPLPPPASHSHVLVLPPPPPLPPAACFRYVHSPAYRTTQHLFEQCQATHDPNSIARLLQQVRAVVWGGARGEV